MLVVRRLVSAVAIATLCSDFHDKGLHYRVSFRPHPAGIDAYIEGDKWVTGHFPKRGHRAFLCFVGAGAALRLPFQPEFSFSDPQFRGGRAGLFNTERAAPNPSCYRKASSIGLASRVFCAC